LRASQAACHTFFAFAAGELGCEVGLFAAFQMLIVLGCPACDGETEAEEPEGASGLVTFDVMPEMWLK
jgi:hypothetical protein